MIALLLAAAFADETVPKVTMTPVGFDRPVDLEKAFDVEIVTKISETEKHLESRIVALRIAYAPLGIGHGSTRKDAKCARIGTGLEEKVDLSKVSADSTHFVTPAAIARSGRGRWAEQFGSDRSVLVSAKSVPTSDGEKQLVRIDAAAYFQAGGRYCLFVVSRIERTVPDETLTLAFNAFDAAAAKCGAETKCLREAKVAYVSTVEVATKKLDTKVKNKANEQVNLLVDAKTQIETVRKRLKPMLDAWPKLLVEAATEPGPGLGTTIRRITKSDHPELYDLILESLAAHGHVRRTDTLQFRPRGGTSEITSLVIVPGADPTRVSAGFVLGAVGNARYDVRVSPGDVGVPGTALTVEDVVRLTRAELRVGDGYVPFDKLSETLAKRYPEEGMGAASDQAEAHHAFKRWADAISDAGTLRTRVPYDTDPDWSLGRWLLSSSSPLRPCNAIPGDAKKAWDRVIQTLPAFSNEGLCKSVREVGFNVWPGGPIDAIDPFVFTAAELESLTREYEQLRVKKVEVAELVKSTTSRRTTASLVGKDTQRKRFMDHYITPVVGFTYVVPEGLRGFGRGFAVPTVGVQVYFWPNPADEPMWVNGQRDLRRLAALDLRVRPSFGAGGSEDATGFGPDDRYGPLDGGVPSLFGSVALQPLPFATINVGGALTRVKGTTDAGERGQIRVVPTLGIALETNFLAGLRKLGTNEGNEVVE